MNCTNALFGRCQRLAGGLSADLCQLLPDDFEGGEELVHTPLDADRLALVQLPLLVGRGDAVPAAVINGPKFSCG